MGSFPLDQEYEVVIFFFPEELRCWGPFIFEKFFMTDNLAKVRIL